MSGFATKWVMQIFLVFGALFMILGLKRKDGGPVFMGAWKKRCQEGKPVTHNTGPFEILPPPWEWPGHIHHLQLLLNNRVSTIYKESPNTVHWWTGSRDMAPRTQQGGTLSTPHPPGWNNNRQWETLAVYQSRTEGGKFTLCPILQLKDFRFLV